MGTDVNIYMPKLSAGVAFRLQGASRFWQWPLGTLMVALLAQPALAQLVVKLQPETLREFQHYQKTVVDPVEQQRTSGRRAFQWIEENPDEREQARSGQVVTHAFTGKDGRSISGGLIHDWVGAVFLPGVSLDRAREFLQDQKLHQDVYQEITSAQTVSCEGNHSITRVRMVKKKYLTVVLDVDYDNTWQSPGAGRWVLRSHTRHVREVQNAGTPDEHAYPEDEGHGFLWRMNSVWRLREADGGAWVELRVVSLSRDAPSSLGWIIKPLIRQFPADSIESTLEGMRNALRGGQAVTANR